MSSANATKMENGITEFQLLYAKCCYCKTVQTCVKTDLFIHCESCDKCIHNTSSFGSKINLLDFTQLHSNSSKK